MNYIKQVMDMLGVAEGERFKLRNKGRELSYTDVYFEDGELRNGSGNPLYGRCNVLGNIIAGEYEIVKQPWIPKYDEYYYCVAHIGNIYCNRWNDSALDIAQLAIGNCFRTKEEAQAARTEILEKFKKILSGDMVLVERNQLQSTEDKQ